MVRTPFKGILCTIRIQGLSARLYEGSFDHGSYVPAQFTRPFFGPPLKPAHQASSKGQVLRVPLRRHGVWHKPGEIGSKLHKVLMIRIEYNILQ